MSWRSLPNEIFDNTNPQQTIFHSLPLQENHSCQASVSTFRLFCATWPIWNNRKSLNLTQGNVTFWWQKLSCLLKLPNSNWTIPSFLVIFHGYFNGSLSSYSSSAVAMFSHRLHLHSSASYNFTFAFLSAFSFHSCNSLVSPDFTFRIVYIASPTLCTFLLGIGCRPFGQNFGKWKNKDLKREK